MVPVIFGPSGPPYIVNHHYLACALHDEKIDNASKYGVGDMSMFRRDAF
jgi:hypothetical protein